MDLDLNLDLNDPDEPYAEVIISISPILIFSLLKYESVPHHHIWELPGNYHVFTMVMVF